MVKEDIETVIDRLYDYVNANRSVSVRDASKVLGLPEEQVEKLAFLLEESNLIEVRYTLTGAHLQSKGSLPQSQEQLKQLTEKPLAKSEDKGRALEEEMQTAENIAEFMQKDLLRRLKSAEGMLASLESQKSFSWEQIRALEREMDSLTAKLELFEVSVKKLEVEGGTFSTKVSSFKERLSKLEKISGRKTFSQKLLELLTLYIAFLRNLVGGIGAKRSKEAGGGVKPETAGKAEQAQESVAPAQKPAPAGKRARGAAVKGAGKTGGKGFKRILEKRVDRVKQHYWRKTGRGAGRARVAGKSKRGKR